MLFTVLLVEWVEQVSDKFNNTKEFFMFKQYVYSLSLLVALAVSPVPGMASSERPDCAEGADCLQWKGEAAKLTQMIKKVQNGCLLLSSTSSQTPLAQRVYLPSAGSWVMTDGVKYSSAGLIKTFCVRIQDLNIPRFFGRWKGPLLLNSNSHMTLRVKNNGSGKRYYVDLMQRAIGSGNSIYEPRRVLVATFETDGQGRVKTDPTFLIAYQGHLSDGPNGQLTVRNLGAINGTSQGGFLDLLTDNNGPPLTAHGSVDLLSTNDGWIERLIRAVIRHAVL